MMIGPWSSGQRVFTFYSDDPSLNTTEVNSVLKKEIYKKSIELLLADNINPDKEYLIKEIIHTISITACE